MAKKPQTEPPMVSLNAETLVALDKGIALAENGRKWTLDEALELARKQRKDWIKVPKGQKSA